MEPPANRGRFSVLYRYYDKRGWLKDIIPQNASWQWIEGFITYSRSATGRVNWLRTHENSKNRFRYTYDYAGRLTFADAYRDWNQNETPSTTTGLDQTFTYDRSGRMLSNSDIGTYVYPTAKQVDGSGNSPHSHAPNTVGGSSNTLSYDDNGNMTTGYDGKTMTYDAENRPLSVSKSGNLTKYVYGADGSRLKKIEKSGTSDENVTVYLDGLEIRDWGAGSGEEFLYYPLPNIRIQTTESGGTRTSKASYIIQDQLGSVLAIYKEDGTLDLLPDYKPFGEKFANVHGAQSVEETKGFIGQRHDPDLIFLNARYYDPALGLFLQPDWFEVTTRGVGTNRYSYAFNDPVNLRDPEGNEISVNTHSVGLG